jgi:hypothetical protein
MRCRVCLDSHRFPLSLGQNQTKPPAFSNSIYADFGVEDSRGTLLRVSFSHKDIASIVGASRPRVTEQLVRWSETTSCFGDGS